MWIFVFFRLHCSSMKLLTVPVFLGYFTAVLLGGDAQQHHHLSRNPQSSHANFVQHPHTILNVSVISSTKENLLDSCAFCCVKNTQCISYNEARSPDTNGKYDCQLLATDKYSSSSDLKPSQDFNHYSIQNPCESTPCQHGGSCRALYATGQYLCNCTSGSFGRRCQYRKLNSCQTMKQSYPSLPDGLYQLNDTSNPGNTFPAYCDMTSFGGGWTMCYTTNNLVDPKDETTYDSSLPYGTNGYRTNCNNIEFSEILFVDEETNQKEFFSGNSKQKLKPIDSYNKGGAEQGLWTPQAALAPSSYSYQLLVCDTSFYSGFMISGFMNGYYKSCESWAGDISSVYFRTSSTRYNNYIGVGFNKNGHNVQPNKLVSVGLR